MVFGNGKVFESGRDNIPGHILKEVRKELEDAYTRAGKLKSRGEEFGAEPLTISARNEGAGFSRVAILPFTVCSPSSCVLEALLF